MEGYWARRQGLSLDDVPIYFGIVHASGLFARAGEVIGFFRNANLLLFIVRYTIINITQSTECSYGNRFVMRSKTFPVTGMSKS